MKNQFTHSYQKEAEIFKALSHPTRLFILDKIRDESYSVSQLAEMAQVDISTMSKHLDLLKRYQIVVGEKSRNHVFYKLNISCLFTFLNCAKKLISCPEECTESTSNCLDCLPK
ncbi:MAG: ArsR/SmtB family transcription factor [Bacteroidota bacterium]